MIMNATAPQPENQPGDVNGRSPCTDLHSRLIRPARQEETLDEGLTDRQFRAGTPDETAAARWFIDAFWPDGPGVRCPRCAWNERARPSLATDKERRYWCPRCRRSFSIKVETVMFRSRLTLQQWKQALFIWTGGPLPVSSKELGRRLGVSSGIDHDVTLRILASAREEFPPLREPAELVWFQPGRQAQKQAQQKANGRSRSQPQAPDTRHRHGWPAFRKDCHWENRPAKQDIDPWLRPQTPRPRHGPVPEQAPPEPGNSPSGAALPHRQRLLLPVVVPEGKDHQRLRPGAQRLHRQVCGGIPQRHPVAGKPPAPEPPGKDDPSGPRHEVENASAIGSRESKRKLRRPAPETWTTAGYEGPTSFDLPGQQGAGPSILHTPGRAINEAPPPPSALRRRTAPNLAMCRRRREPSASPAARQETDHAKEQGPPNSESAGARPAQTREKPSGATLPPCPPGIPNHRPQIAFPAIP